MEATRRCVNANRRLCKCTQAYSDSNATDRNNGRACTLQDDKN